DPRGGDSVAALEGRTAVATAQRADFDATAARAAQAETRVASRHGIDPCAGSKMGRRQPVELRDARCPARMFLQTTVAHRSIPSKKWGGSAHDNNTHPHSCRELPRANRTAAGCEPERCQG